MPKIVHAKEPRPTTPRGPKLTPAETRDLEKYTKADLYDQRRSFQTGFERLSFERIERKKRAQTCQHLLGTLLKDFDTLSPDEQKAVLNEVIIWLGDLV